MRKVLLPFICVVFLAACGEPKIGASSPQALKESFSKVTKSLPPDKQAAFATDMRVANLMAIEGLSTADGAGAIQGQVAKFFDGKSAADNSLWRGARLVSIGTDFAGAPIEF